MKTLIVDYAGVKYRIPRDNFCHAIWTMETNGLHKCRLMI
jgi:hypothetical protein